MAIVRKKVAKKPIKRKVDKKTTPISIIGPPTSTFWIGPSLKHKVVKKAIKRKNPSMTYGILPTYIEFSKAFDRIVGKEETFNFGRDKRVGSVNFTKEELWIEIKRAIREDTDESKSWVDDILYSLDFEWV